MPSPSVQKGKTPWNKAAFEKMKAGWSAERVARDEKRLKTILAMAAMSPSLTEALNWAVSHGVEFFIDHTMVDSSAGYYAIGTGIIGISIALPEVSPVTARTLAHEIRHAWQDYHGFIASPDQSSKSGEFTKFFMQNALVEADATAFENRVRNEMNAARHTSRRRVVQEQKGLVQSIFNLFSGTGAATGAVTPQPVLIEKTEDIRNNFLDWFLDMPTISYYGGQASKFFGEMWGVYKGEVPDRCFEFVSEGCVVAGIDVDSYEEILKLGKGFSEGNYLTALPKDLLFQQILRPSFVRCFYGAANKEDKQLVAEVRKCELRQKIKNQKKAKRKKSPPSFGKWFKASGKPV